MKPRRPRVVSSCGSIHGWPDRLQCSAARPVPPRHPSQIVPQEDLKGRPVILCAYSNGGCQVIEFLLRAAYSGDKAGEAGFCVACCRERAVHDTHQAAPERLFVLLIACPAAKAFLQDRLAGYLFDSCPAKISAHAISTALAIGFKRQGWLASSAAYWLFYLLFSAWILFAVLGFSELRQDVLHSVLANDPSRVPTLFIYSDNDEITECGALENFIERRAAICSTKVEGGPAATSCSDAASQEVRGQSSDTLEHEHKDGTSFGTRPTRKRSESRER